MYVLRIKIRYEADTFKSIKNSAVSVVVSKGYCSMSQINENFQLAVKIFKGWGTN